MAHHVSSSLDPNASPMRLKSPKKTCSHSPPPAETGFRDSRSTYQIWEELRGHFEYCRSFGRFSHEGLILYLQCHWAMYAVTVCPWYPSPSNCLLCAIVPGSGFGTSL